jgi:putative ABC transport system permease protein
VAATNYITSATAHAADFDQSGATGPVTSPNTLILGMTDSARFDEFANADDTLTAGRPLTAADRGKPEVMVEQLLATQDGLKPGDSLTVTSVSGGDNSAEFTIVGVYRNKNDSQYESDTARNPANMLIVPYTEVAALTGSPTLSYAAYYMDDPLNVDSFRDNVLKLGLPNITPDQVDTQNDVYQRMAGPLNNLHLISIIMVAGIMIAGAIILSLIIALSMKTRKYEIGVLLSVGEHKFRIMTQMVLEILLPVIVAFSLSIATGSLAAQQIGSGMFATQAQTSSSMLNQTGSGITDTRTGMTYKPVSRIDVSVTSQDMLELYLAGILLALISAAAPLTMIMRYQPKNILIQTE